MADVAIQVRHVSKRFHQGGDSYIEALKDISLDAYLGEILMIVGPSGSGKTTLLSVIAGTLHFDTGEIIVFDTSLNSLTEAEVTQFRGKNIGFIFQQYHLIRSLNCMENVSIPMLLNGASINQSDERAIEILGKVGLEGREKDRPDVLSGGQQQRVAIARALVHHPRLVICDEPTSALDAETGAHIMELMVEVARMRDRCVLIVTHDSRIFKYADRIAEMNDGQIVNIHYNHGHKP